MKKFVLILALLASLFLAGCCDRPGVFAQIQQSYTTIQTAALPLADPYISDIPEVQLAIAASNIALALANQLQAQWCPAQAEADKLTAMAKALQGSTNAMRMKGLIRN